jgi:hypothetical protein
MVTLKPGRRVLGDRAVWVFSLIARLFEESMDRARRVIAVHPNLADVRYWEQSGTTLLAQSITAF